MHFAQLDLAGDGGTGFLADERVEAGGQLALGRGDIGIEQRLGHDEAEDPVAQKLQPLVRGSGDAGGGAVGHGFGQQVRVPELVPEPGLEGFERARKRH